MSERFRAQEARDDEFERCRTAGQYRVHPNLRMIDSEAPEE